MLRAPGRLADECKTGMVRQRIDRGRLSGVGSTRKGDFRSSVGRQLRPVSGRGQKFGMMKRVCGARIGA
jgi:hypothetical protein